MCAQNFKFANDYAKWGFFDQNFALLEEKFSDKNKTDQTESEL